MDRGEMEIEDISQVYQSGNRLALRGFQTCWRRLLLRLKTSIKPGATDYISWLRGTFIMRLTSDRCK